MNRNFGWFIAVAFAAGALLAGCGGGDEEPASEAPPTRTAEAPAGVTGQGDTQAPADQEGDVDGADGGSEEPEPVDTSEIGVIENPDDPASSRKAATAVSKATTDAFSDRNPTTFCELIDPKFIERQFENGMEGCEAQMGKILAPNSAVPDLQSGKMVIKGNTASMKMTTPNGDSAGVATFVKRGDRWYLSMDSAAGGQ